MEIIEELTRILSALIVSGCIARSGFCFIRIACNPDEAEEYKGKIKNSIIFAVLTVCVYVLKNIVQGLFR